jgi:hypothetical protein
MALNNWMKYFVPIMCSSLRILPVSFWIEVINGCLDISSCEAGDRRLKLVGDLHKLKIGFSYHKCGTGGVRLKYGG